MTRPPVLVKQSLRTEYDHLRYAYPEAYRSLVRTMDSKPIPGLLKGGQSSASPGGRCRSGGASGAGPPAEEAPTAEELLSMTHEELLGHLERQASGRLRRRLDTRRPGRTRSEPQLGTGPAAAAASGSEGWPWLEGDEDDPAVRDLRIKKNKFRNWCGGLYADEPRWQKVAAAPAVAVLPPGSTPKKQRPPLSPDSHRKVQEEIAFIRKQRLQCAEPRSDGGKIFLDPFVAEKP